MMMLIPPRILTWIFGAALCVVLLYALIRRWRQDWRERRLREIRFLADEPPELPPGE